MLLSEGNRATNHTSSHGLYRRLIGTLTIAVGHPFVRSDYVRRAISIFVAAWVVLQAHSHLLTCHSVLIVLPSLLLLS